MPHRPLRRLAFTLLEVLLAVGLFTLASAVLIQSASDALRAYEAVRGDSDHEQLYRFVLRQALSVEDRDEFEEGGDVLLPDDRNAEWEAEVEETGLVDLFRVQVTISIEAGRFSNSTEPEERVYVARLYRPDWYEAGSGDREDILSDRQQAMEDRRRGY